MPDRITPPFRADHVGSLIRPDTLIKAREAAEKGEMTAAELARIQHEAIRDIVRLQQEAGLKLATDGEYNRFSWQRDFLLKIDNVKSMASKLTVRFHSAAGTRDHTPPSMQVVGKLSLPSGGIFVDDFKFLKSVA
jgi:5-methyltetrahydropteroyltriglutamate--homocysteine methyltransferase